MKHVKIYDYTTARAYLGGKDERPYAHNTRIESVPADSKIVAKYHGHTVAEFYQDGFNSYSSCGWKTITTKERINWFLPEFYRLYQDHSQWYLSYVKNYDWQNATRYTWQDGICINLPNNEVTGYLQDDNTPQILKQIKKYVTGYIKELLSGKMEKPSGGDCWYCAMQTTDGKNLGDATNNTDHIYSHFEESYYVPSLLYNAYKFNSRLSMMTQDGIARLTSGESISVWQQSIVERDVKACLTSYLKHVLGIAQ